ncbi:MAG: hypothetical protein A2042_03835 [Candidatus Schekmanbacteria bacterium GWA2_38_11]|uniref:Membrane protein insertase YidC n=1 Tax=Candidatus Schekmanbacteria bacterium GWA2_38_11 TaxID=1817876 RepID=A0A1F7RQW4_9BACT|nr:MAG: hypothetical protein A2042_03835 [Candidatus Schekmanbacteria bacterium GWA2_38_11]
MQIRLIFFIILSLVIIMSYQYIFLPKPEDLAKGEKKTAEGVIDKNKVLSPAEPVPEVREKLIKTLGSSYPEKGQPTAQDQSIFIDTDLYQAKFSKNRAILKELVLKKYNDKDGNRVKLIGKGEKEESPRTLDFVLTTNSSSPLSFTFDADKKSLNLSKNEPKGIIKFTSFSADGVEIIKSFKFDNDSYLMDINIEVKNLKEAPADFSSQIILGPHFYPGADTVDSSSHFGPIVDFNNKVIREKPEKIKEPVIFSNGNVGWIGIESKYFLASVMPEQKNFSAFMLNDKNKESLVGLQSAKSKIESNGKLSQSYKAYLGPKEFNELKAVKLENAIDFGWFGIFGIPLLQALNFFNSYLKNYGLSIIVITLIIKIFFIPFTQKSFKSMQAMQKLQPQIKALRERYKKEPQKLNQETMELYKKNKVNPLGGCLPMVLQIPVFIAFYNVLLSSIELRGAPFFLWIHDLSAKDPYYITPIIMGITMFIQQKMSPTSPDPKQAQIMLVMPVVFTFMFMSFPTGLVLYWTVNNLLTIGQQYLIMGKVSTKEGEEIKGKSKKKRA